MNRFPDRSREADIHLELMIFHVLNYNTMRICSQYFSSDDFRGLKFAKLIN